MSKSLFDTCLYERQQAVHVIDYICAKGSLEYIRQIAIKAEMSKQKFILEGFVVAIFLRFL